MTSFLAERARYIESAGREGGNAAGFREWIANVCEEDPKLYPYAKLRDAAATKAWEAQPRKKGPDLFSVAGIPIPEFLTRRAHGFVEDADDDGFVKVSANYSTLVTYREDAEIKMLNAADATASARDRYRNYDVLLRVAGGDPTRLLRDLKD
jgi:hypothetical protein